MGFCMCKTPKFFTRKKSLVLMFTMTTSFFIAEISVGYITNSTALVADSFHMLSDVISLVVGFFALLYSKKDSKHNTYGWVRAEVLGGLANAVFLFALCFTIIVSAIQRIVEIEEITQPILILYVGGAGFLINLIGLCIFYGHTRTQLEEEEDDDDDYDDDQNNIKVESNKNTDGKNAVKKNRGSQLIMKGVFLHVLGDALGSVVVLVSALTIKYAEGDWKNYIDPAMSLVIATIILCSTWPLLKESSLILLQNPPGHIDKDDLLNEFLQIDGIQDIHEFHIWQLSGNIIIASAHIIMHKGDNFDETAVKVNKLFHKQGIHSLTLQPEFYDCPEGHPDDGADTCDYLKSTTVNIEKIIEKDASKPLQNVLRKRRNSPCLFPCVSTKCKKFQCCSHRENENQKNSNKANEENLGLGNPGYIDVDSDIEEPETKNDVNLQMVNNFDESVYKLSSLPGCDNMQDKSSNV